MQAVEKSKRRREPASAMRELRGSIWNAFSFGDRSSIDSRLAMRVAA
jgi:hypothetical protein